MGSKMFFKNYSGERVMLYPFSFYIFTLFLKTLITFFSFLEFLFCLLLRKRKTILFSPAKFSLIGIFSSSSLSTSRGTPFWRDDTEKKFDLILSNNKHIRTTKENVGNMSATETAMKTEVFHIKFFYLLWFLSAWFDQ